MLNSPPSQTGQDTMLVSQHVMWLGGFTQFVTEFTQLSLTLGGLNLAER